VRVHLEGMGVPGCFLAWHLERAGVEWTWDDIDSPFNAWSACTGAIYPSGVPFDVANYSRWRAWVGGSAPWPASLTRECVEEAGWWYCTKAAPHGGKYKTVATVGALKRGSATSLHYNAQKFVPATREAFAERRRTSAEPGAQRVVTHGFGRRNHHVLWGWTVLVKLDIDQTLLAHETCARPSLYMRKGRFVMAYAYAVPGTPWWYSGSSLIVQKVPKQLEVPEKLARWRMNFEALAGGLARVSEVGSVITGWRPAGADDSAPLVLRLDDGALHVRPFWNSGVRHSPVLVEAVMDSLGVA